MVDAHDDELTPEQTEGFKVGEKKTIDEYQQLGKLAPCPPFCLHMLCLPCDSNASIRRRRLLLLLLPPPPTWPS
ncbi:uncharacterized protein IWZ02DRAFT_466311 [Phyllosticta citriasiana]|uniref:uncharacterized protein n=1 Tax=Phyllosticta citriasiana TaxID=595635 RepID=UPI0030FDD533